MANQYNKNKLNTSPMNQLLRKALTTDTNVGEALIPQSLERIITNTVIELAPQFGLLRTKGIKGKKHEFNRLNTLPSEYGAMGESGVTPTSSSAYSRENVTLKEIRRKGAVTDFESDASEEYIDAYAQEIEAVAYKHALDMNYFTLWGNADANTYEFSGLDRLITGDSRLNEGFSSGAPTVPTSLSFLDSMIDRAMERGGSNLEFAFYCTPRMKSKITTLSDGYGRGVFDIAGKLEQIEIAAGKRVTTYRGIPIYDTTFLGGRTSGTMGTVTAAGAATGGSLSDGTYYFRVAPVSYKGEEQASAEVSITLSGGTATQKITLSFSDFTGANAYKVYYSATTGLSGMAPIKMVSAYTYTSGAVSARVTSIVLTAVTAGTEVDNMTSDKPLTAVSTVKGESVILHCLDPYQGLGEFVFTNSKGNKFDGVVTYEDLAKTDAYRQFMLRTTGALVPSFAETSIISRGWRVA
jgi:hypothetical protein